MEHKTRPEAQIPEALVKIAEQYQKNPAFGERALRLFAAIHGLSPEEALALLRAGDLEALARLLGEAPPSPVPEAPATPPSGSALQDGNFAVQHSPLPPKGVAHPGVSLEVGGRCPLPGFAPGRWDPECCTATPTPALTRQIAVQDGKNRALAWVQRLLRETLAETPEDDPRRQPLQDLLALAEEKGLEAGPLRLLLLLAALGRRYLRETAGPKAVRKASQVAFHLPLDLVAAYLQVHRATVWRWTERLEEAGLVRARTHVATAVWGGEERNLNTGTVWAVRLKPGRARLRYEDLAHPWRDLRADLEEGRTAYRVIYPKGKRRKDRPVRPSLELLVKWTLGIREVPALDFLRPAPTENPTIEAAFLLAEMEAQDRPTVIDLLSERMAHELGDPHSRRFYAGLLWKVVEGKLSPHALVHAYHRARAALREGYARRGGAFLQHLLEAAA
ncbi:hypothetical protein [Thermus thermophilus]|uniref:hypothetical protein n=1 Tax=Thermus thermophilus TaxID=274 RepID=UPI0023DF9397|nr:hypothetical protein [Thermus thermophilus]